MTDSSILNGLIIGLLFFGVACLLLATYLKRKLRVHRAVAIRFTPGYLLIDDKLIKALPQAIILDQARINQVGIEAATRERVQQLARLN